MLIGLLARLIYVKIAIETTLRLLFTVVYFGAMTVWTCMSFWIDGLDFLLLNFAVKLFENWV